jgi:hypothetical protein
MHLADQRIVFDAKMNARMPSVNEGHAQRRPIDLVVESRMPNVNFFGIIGCPPDSLAFARSDRSGRNE